MSRKFALASAIAAALATTAPAAAADSLAAGFDPLAFLAGSCWRGPAAGNPGVDTHCFSPILGGHFLRDRHRVEPGGYAGETLYRWDAVAREMRWDYYASDGMLMSGTASGTDQGLTFTVTSVAPADAAPAGMRVTWRRDGADAYVVTTRIREGDTWRAVPGSPRFERIGPAPAD